MPGNRRKKNRLPTGDVSRVRYQEVKPRVEQSSLNWQRWLLVLGCVGAGAAILYMIMRNYGMSSNALVSAPSPDFLANCNTTNWRTQPANISNSNFVNKARLFLNNNMANLPKLQNASAIMTNITDRVRSHEMCSRGCQFIDVVLNHQNLTVRYIDRALSTTAGLYSPEECALVFSTLVTTLHTNMLMQLSLRVFWMAYKTLVHTHYVNPADLNLSIADNPALSYSLHASDHRIRQQTLQAAIEKGDNRILNEVPELLQKERNHLLTPKEKELLNKYKNAARTYLPQRVDFKYASDHPKIAEIVKIIDGGGKTRLTQEDHGYLIEMWADDYSYDEMTNSYSIQGYRLSNPEDRLTALAADTYARKHWHPELVKDGKFGRMVTAVDTILTHADQAIAGCGEGIGDVFYRERAQFHNCEHNENFSEIESFSSLNMGL